MLGAVTAIVAAILRVMLVVGLALALYISASTWPAAELWPTDDPATAQRVQWERDHAAHNVPTWGPAYAAAFPRCHQPRTGEVPARVLVVTLNADSTVLPFDEAWGRATDTDTANDVWVVGHCNR